MNTEFKKFYRPKDYKYKSYVLNGDQDKIEVLADLLAKHEIEYGWGKNGSTKGYHYNSGKNESLKTSENSLVVSTEQKKGTLVKVLFEPYAVLSDSLTYDITAWSLPYAYGLDAVASESRVASNSATNKKKNNAAEEANISEEAFAFLSSWDSFNDAQFLTDLIKARYTGTIREKTFCHG